MDRYIFAKDQILISKYRLVPKLTAPADAWSVCISCHIRLLIADLKHASWVYSRHCHPLSPQGSRRIAYWCTVFPTLVAVMSMPLIHSFTFFRTNHSHLKSNRYQSHKWTTQITNYRHITTNPSHTLTNPRYAPASVALIIWRSLASLLSTSCQSVSMSTVSPAPMFSHWIWLECCVLRACVLLVCRANAISKVLFYASSILA